MTAYKAIKYMIWVAALLNVWLPCPALAFNIPSSPGYADKPGYATHSASTYNMEKDDFIDLSDPYRFEWGADEGFWTRIGMCLNSANVFGMPFDELCVPSMWNWSGPGYGSGVDKWLDDGGETFFNECQEYWIATGPPTGDPIENFYRDKKTAIETGGAAAKKCFTAPVWGTPDECAYAHDIAYAKVENADYCTKLKGQIAADNKLVDCAEDFAFWLHGRRVDYKAMSDEEKAYTKTLIEIFMIKIYYQQRDYNKSCMTQEVNAYATVVADLTKKYIYSAALNINVMYNPVTLVRIGLFVQ